MPFYPRAKNFPWISGFPRSDGEKGHIPKRVRKDERVMTKLAMFAAAALLAATPAAATPDDDDQGSDAASSGVRRMRSKASRL